MRTALRLIKIMLPVWPVMLAAAGFGWLTIAANIGLMATSALLIATAALQPSVAELSVAIVGVRFFGVSRAIFRYLERYIAHDATFKLLGRIRSWFFTRLEPLAPARLQAWQSGELFSAIVGDVETLKDFYLRVLAPPLIAVLILLGMVVFLQQFSSGLALLLVGAFVFAGILMPLLVRCLNRGSGTKLVAARAELNAYLADTVNGIAELAAFDRKERQLAGIGRIQERLTAFQGKVAAVSALTEAAGNLTMNSALWGALCITIPLVHSGLVAGVYLPVLALAVQSSFEAVLVLPMAVHHLAESLAAARRLFAIADTAPAVRQPATAARLPAYTGLIVRNVSFEYDAWGQVLHEVSFDLPPGKRLAIVGPSGAGKSTIIHLLLRFWEYDSGRITLGGTDYRTLPPEEIRSVFNVVSQQTHIFNASIRDNILIAQPSAGEEALKAAVQGAALTEFIAALPQGLDTAVGHNGQALSGGQRQRIAIARALLKAAPVVLLDEPTTGLDAVTEKQIMATLAGLSRDRATLLITHRLTGLETMDEILVLEAGRVAERGRFPELMAGKGLFYRLYNLQ